MSAETDFQPSSRQMRAVAALCASRTIRDASVSAGVGESTIRRWLHDDGFRGYLSARCEAMLNEAASKAQAGASKAVSVLVELMDSETTPTQQRVAAAKAVLDASLKLTELCGVLQRLDALEAENATSVPTFVYEFSRSTTERLETHE